jgi:hypothetical protein
LLKIPVEDDQQPDSTPVNRPLTQHSTPAKSIHVFYSWNLPPPFSPDATPSERDAAIQRFMASRTPGQVIPDQHIDRTDQTPSPSPRKTKSITVNGTIIRYNADTLPEPPTLSYRTREQFHNLVEDWTSGSFITIDGIGIPLRFWKDLYSWTRPAAWKRMKDQWSKFKLFVGAFNGFSAPEEFWNSLSVPPTNSRAGMANFKRISDELRVARNERDQEDAERAKAEYTGDEFDTSFSYRKRGKVFVMKKDFDIARRYRRLQEIPATYWDDERAVGDIDIDIDIDMHDESS